MTRCRTSRCCQSASCSSDRYSYASQQRQLQRQRRSMKSKLAPWQLRVSVRDTRPGDKISKITCTSPRMKTKARTPEAHPGHTLVPASNSGHAIQNDGKTEQMKGMCHAPREKPACNLKLAMQGCVRHVAPPGPRTLGPRHHRVHVSRAPPETP